jgi:hypothetical protein
VADLELELEEVKIGATRDIAALEAKVKIGCCCYG